MNESQFNYDNFYEQAREKGFTNNQIRKSMLDNGFSKEYVDSKRPLDLNEIRDEFIASGKSEEDFDKSIEALPRNIDKDLYKANGRFAQTLKVSGMRREKLVDSIAQVIKNQNFSRNEALKFMQNFLGMSGGDVDKIEQAIYPKVQSIQEIDKRLKEEGMNEYARQSEAVREWRRQQQVYADGSQVNPAYESLAEGVGYGLAAWTNETINAFKTLFGMEKSFEDNMLDDYLQWRLDENIVSKGTATGTNLAVMFAPTGTTLKATKEGAKAASFLKQMASFPLEATLAGVGAFVDSKLSGKDDKEAKTDMYLSLVLSGALQGLGKMIEVGVNKPEGKSFVGHLATSAKDKVLGAFEKVGEVAAKPYINKVSDDLISQYANDPKARKALLDSLQLLGDKEDKILFNYLAKDPSESSFLNNFTYYTSRGLLPNSYARQIQAGIQNKLVNSIDTELSKFLPAKQYDGVIEGQNRFQNEVKNVLDFVKSKHMQTKAELYKSVDKVGNRIQLDTETAKQLMRKLSESKEFSRTLADIDASEVYRRKVSKILSPISMGQDLVAQSRQTAKELFKEFDKTEVDSAIIRDFRELVNKSFQDKFSPAELKEALKATNTFIKNSKKKDITTPELETLDIYKRSLETTLRERLKKAPTLTDIRRANSQLNDIWNRDISSAHSIVSKTLADISNKLGSPTYINQLDKANKHYVKGVEIFEKKPDGGESLGINQVMNAVDSQSFALLKVLNGEGGSNFAHQFSELVKDYSKARNKPAEYKKIREKVARYYIDSKIHSQLSRTASPEDITLVRDKAVSVYKALSEVDSNIVRTLTNDKVVGVLDNYKDILSRYIEADKLVTPNKWSSELGMSLSFWQKALSLFTTAKILHNPKNAQRVLNRLRVMEGMPTKDYTKKVADLFEGSPSQVMETTRILRIMGALGIGEATGED